MTHDEMIAVIAHHKNGGEVQCKNKQVCDYWINESHIESEGFDFTLFDYRAKPEPIINRPTSDKGLDAMHCSALVDALAEVLSHHALACVSGLNLHDKPWLFDVTENGSPLITPESCKCSTNSKYLRAILPANHPKGFSQNAIAQTPPTAVDLPRLVRQSYFGTVRLTIGCMDRMCQVTYYNDKREKQDIRGTSQEVADHINSLPNTPAQDNNNQNETE